MTIKTFNKNSFVDMEQRYRVHFINSLSGYKSANLIGTISESGITNLAMISSVVHLGADPALVAFINRPHSVERDTLDNIYNSRCYTLNHVSKQFFKAAHHTAARYPSEISEFDQAGLSEHYGSLKAPYVAQSSIKLGIEFKEKIDIKLNDTVMIVGEIIEVILDDTLIAQDGKINLEASQTVAVSGLDEYHTAQSLGRLAYAKPKI